MLTDRLCEEMLTEDSVPRDFGSVIGFHRINLLLCLHGGKATVGVMRSAGGSSNSRSRCSLCILRSSVVASAMSRRVAELQLEGARVQTLAVARQGQETGRLGGDDPSAFCQIGEKVRRRMVRRQSREIGRASCRERVYVLV